MDGESGELTEWEEVVGALKGSLKVISNVPIRQSTYDFLIDFNTNYASITYVFQL